MLYHGYSTADAEAIHKTGLAPGTFLTADPEYAQRAAEARAKFVGGKPAVITVSGEDAGDVEPSTGGSFKTRALIRPEKFKGK